MRARLLLLALLGLVTAGPAHAGAFSGAAKVVSVAGKAVKVGKVATFGAKVGIVATSAQAVEHAATVLAALPQATSRGAAVLVRSDEGLHLVTRSGTSSVPPAQLAARIQSASVDAGSITRLYVDATALDDVPRVAPAGIEEMFVVGQDGVPRRLERGAADRWHVELDGDLVDVAELALDAFGGGAEVAQEGRPESSGWVTLLVGGGMLGTWGLFVAYVARIRDRTV